MHAVPEVPRSAGPQPVSVARFECHFCGDWARVDERSYLGREQFPTCHGCFLDFEVCSSCRGSGTAYETDPFTGRSDPVPCPGCEGEGIVTKVEMHECVDCGKVRVCHSVTTSDDSSSSEWFCYGCSPSQR